MRLDLEIVRASTAQNFLDISIIKAEAKTFLS